MRYLVPSGFPMGNTELAKHSSTLTTLKVAPAYDTVRDEPRFEDLLRRLGF
jgi:hypothetical protein